MANEWTETNIRCPICKMGNLQKLDTMPGAEPEIYEFEDEALEGVAHDGVILKCPICYTDVYPTIDDFAKRLVMG